MALYVHPEYWSTGVGVALWTRVLDRVTADGFDSIVLWVLDTNLRARTFYERLGFEVDSGGTRSEQLGDGITLSEVRYRRSLSGYAMMQSDPRDWSVLKNGSATQRKAFEILSSMKLFDELRSFDPAHIGTIGNDIDIPGSDIDIICSCSDFDALESALQRTWTSRFVVQCRRSLSRGIPVFVATISSEIPIEIYAEATAIEQQLGFRHYHIACRLLKIFGEAARFEIRKMKAEGIKTEPAFARYLGLSGDPYLALLEVEQMTDTQITAHYHSL